MAGAPATRQAHSRAPSHYFVTSVRDQRTSGVAAPHAGNNGSRAENAEDADIRAFVTSRVARQEVERSAHTNGAPLTAACMCGSLHFRVAGRRPAMAIARPRANSATSAT